MGEKNEYSFETEVEEQILSDGSKAYNLLIHANNFTLRLACSNKAEARNLEGHIDYAVSRIDLEQLEGEQEDSADKERECEYGHTRQTCIQDCQRECPNN